MKGICGWINHYAEPRERLRTITDMANAMSDKQQPLVAHGNNHAVALTDNEKGHLYQDQNITIAVCGHPYWRHHDLAVVNKQEGFAKSLLTAYQQFNTGLFGYLGGSFSLAIIDTSLKQTILAVDRIGQQSLAYCMTSNALLFGSNCDAIAHHPLASCDIDPQAVFNYLYFHVIPGETTIYQNWHRLTPGHYLLLQDGVLKKEHYWKICFKEENRASFRELRDEFRSLLETCVAACTSDENTGAFLSGGTDSSTVVGMLSRIQSHPTHTYSIGFDVAGYDETEYARIAARHFGAMHHVYTLSPDDVVTAIPIVADAYDLPYGNSSAIPTYYCAKLAAAEGMQCLLGGDGGDELFGGNTRYAKQRKFTWYTNLPEMLRRQILEPTLLNFPAGDKLPFINKARRYIQQANIPMPLRMESYNLVRYIGTTQLLTEEFANAVDIEEPDTILKNIYDNALANSMINKMLALDIRITLADNDLPKVTRMCESAGIEAAFPLLHDDIVSFSAQLPTAMKLRGTTLRYFFKKALEDFLPREVITKQKHGFGLPFGAWLESHSALREITCDSLSAIKHRGILNHRFLDNLMHDYLTQHSGYYGSMIWIIMMLEQWFSRRASGWRL